MSAFSTSFGDDSKGTVASRVPERQPVRADGVSMVEMFQPAGASLHPPPPKFNLEWVSRGSRMTIVFGTGRMKIRPASKLFVSDNVDTQIAIYVSYVNSQTLARLFRRERGESSMKHRRMRKQ